MKATFLGVLLLLATLAMGCGGGDGSKTLDIADIGWTENTAIANLTKVLLEEELGYDQVLINNRAELTEVYEAVATGELDAFQDVWLPNQQDLLSSVEEDVEQLSFSYQGQTEQGITIPSYMDINSLDQLNESEAEMLFGIEPESVIMQRISEEVIPAYNLKQKFVESSTDAMLAEIDNYYRNQEEFAFVAWSPHWMNQKYDLIYLEDPKDALGELNDPARITTIVNEDLPEGDPVATAFMDALKLDEEQLNGLESTINEAGEPEEGARQWAQENRDVWQPWVEAAQSAEEA
ncbi:MAG TPA: glycine betaine ABC transporter substrate-binding protein [Rubrobacteraceae bacterium]|nr:glycine betaine ABC transporter substrate-binding protein [Rubrobacteraceae bacterium]